MAHGVNTEPPGTVPGHSQMASIEVLSGHHDSNLCMRCTLFPLYLRPSLENGKHFFCSIYRASLVVTNWAIVTKDIKYMIARMMATL